MKIVIDIPEEQIKKSLKESKHIHEDEGEKGFVNIMMLYTNGQLDFVDVSRKTDFYSCKYKILQKGHGDLIDKEKLKENINGWYAFMKDICKQPYMTLKQEEIIGKIDMMTPIIEADKESEDE